MNPKESMKPPANRSVPPVDLVVEIDEKLVVEKTRHALSQAFSVHRRCPPLVEPKMVEPIAAGVKHPELLIILDGHRIVAVNPGHDPGQPGEALTTEIEVGAQHRRQQFSFQTHARRLLA
jgi:hypothetical protein